MTYKGIARGDSTYRHFTFDDTDVLEKDGDMLYKVNYGKDTLEGDHAEDEIGYVRCSDVIFLGGKKPNLPQPQNKQTETVPEKTVESPKKNEVPEKTKPVKVAKTEKKSAKIKKTKEKVVEEPAIKILEQPEWNPATGQCIFEYTYKEFHTEDIKRLQELLNVYGNEGWEMCGFDTNKSLLGEMSIFAVFKRRKVE